jgi:hypothetical protein
MNILHKNHRNLFDLPNEILLIIIKKLNIDDVIYSLANVNERFTQLVFDPLYIQDFDITMMTMNSFYDRTFSIHEQVLSNICQNILPKIHNQIKKLTIEQHSIGRILPFNYSQLYSLSLINFQEKILFQYLTGRFSSYLFSLIFIPKMSFDFKIVQFFVIFLHNRLHISILIFRMRIDRANHLKFHQVHLS